MVPRKTPACANVWLPLIVREVPEIAMRPLDVRVPSPQLIEAVGRSGAEQLVATVAMAPENCLPAVAVIAGVAPHAGVASGGAHEGCRADRPCGAECSMKGPRGRARHVDSSKSRWTRPA